MSVPCTSCRGETSSGSRRRYQSSDSDSDDDCGGVTISQLPTGAIPIDPPAARRPRYDARVRTSRRELDLGSYKTIRPLTLPCSVTPLKDLRTPYSSNQTQVNLSFLRKDGKVIMGWEQFEGVLGSNGAACLRFEQTLPSLPATPIRQVISISYNSKPKLGILSIDPGYAVSLTFYLDCSTSGEEVKQGDTVIIYGGTICWIADD